MAIHKNGEKKHEFVRSNTMPEVIHHDPPPSKRNRSRRPGNRSPGVFAPPLRTPQISVQSQRDHANAPTRNPEVPASQEQGNWDEVASGLEDHDEKMVKKWNEQIDTLLVFAGLFSAVVTAFNVESYHQLKLDADEASKALLLTISYQIAELPRAMQTGNISNATAAVLAQLDSFEPDEADIWVNTLWFASLVCSLIAASLGILVKQWLQRYKTEDHSLARERTRIRQFRFAGLLRWNMPGIISFLPLLLRTSLNLFFIGMIVFLRTLYWPVATAISILIGAWFFVYFGSLILPAIYPDCPYKSPEAMLFYTIRRMKEDGIKNTLEHLSFVSWSDAEQFIKFRSTLDVETLVTVDQTFADRGLKGMIRGCLKDLDTESAMSCIRRIISYRLHTRVDIVSRWRLLNTSRITKSCAETLINILLDTIERYEGYISAMKDTARMVVAAQWLEDALECVVYLLSCLGVDAEAPSLDERLLSILPKLVEAASSWKDAPLLVQSGVIAVICSRPSLCQVPFSRVLSKLLLTATSVLTDSGDAGWQGFQPYKLCHVMLSLIDAAEPESLDESIMNQFIVACGHGIGNAVPKPLINVKSCDDLIHDITICLSKLEAVEGKCPGITARMAPMMRKRCAHAQRTKVMLTDLLSTLDGGR